MPTRRLTTVVTAAADQLLVTLTDLKTDLGITTDKFDTYLNRAISSASADIAKYCGRTFKSETVDETFFVEANIESLLLSRFPVGTITSVTVDGEAIASTLYTPDINAGLLLRLDTDADLSWWSEGKIVVRYAGGYTTIETDLQAACVSIVKGRQAARNRDPGLRSEKIPNVYEASYQILGPGDADLPADIRAVLDHYIARSI